MGLQVIENKKLDERINKILNTKINDLNKKSVEVNWYPNWNDRGIKLKTIII